MAFFAAGLVAARAVATAMMVVTAAESYRRFAYREGPAPQLTDEQVSAAQDAKQLAQAALDAINSVDLGDSANAEDLKKALPGMQRTVEVSTEPGTTVQDVQNAGMESYELLRSIAEREKGNVDESSAFEETSNPVLLFMRSYAAFCRTMS